MKQVGLVFQRDLKSQVKKKAFIVTLVALFAGTLGALFVPQFFESDGEFTVAVDSATPQPLREALGEQEGFIVEEVKRAEEARGLVEEGAVDAGLAGEVLYVSGAPARATELQQVYQSYTALETAEELGLTEGEIAQLFTPSPLQEVNVGDEAAPLKMGIASVAVIGLFLLLMTSVWSVAMGVVEEKGSRIVELLVVPLNPLQLLAGKILAFGVVGLLQLAAVGLGLLAGLPLTDFRMPGAWAGRLAC